MLSSMAEPAGPAFPDRAAQPRGQEAARSRRSGHAGSRFSHAYPPYFV